MMKTDFILASVNRDTLNILMVNPWIHDFAAYDFWAKPVGLLTLASILRTHGCVVSYIDCLDRFYPKMPKTDPCARFGRGPYLKTRIEKPVGFEDIPRHYSRYGIKPQWFIEELLSIPKPDLVLVTSFMTYWYPGVNETIRTIKEIFPDVPLVLGGIYATLCSSHAKNCSGADKIIQGDGESKILELVSDFTGFKPKKKTDSIRFDPYDLDSYPYPAIDLQNQITYVPILTSKGCPFSCAYCASNYLNPLRMLRSPDSVIKEIIYWHDKYSVRDFVFYDDALLVDAEKHAIPIFEGIIKADLNVRFHTPNAVHIREISQKTASLMFEAGFKTLRLGLEATEFKHSNRLDTKVTGEEFKNAVSYLKKAGFKKNQIGAYLLAGLPGQPVESVYDSIKTVMRSRITPIIAYYTPIPHTSLWEDAVSSSRYDLESDPVFTNNAVSPCQNHSFSWKTVSHLKGLSKRSGSRLTT